MSQEITVKCECFTCQGTGLCIVWNCHDGAARVCQNCGGTGVGEFSYTPFTGRKKTTEVKRVFSTDAAWRRLFSSEHTFDNGTTIDFSQYGCTLEEWEAGAEPKPLPEIDDPS